MGRTANITNITMTMIEAISKECQSEAPSKIQRSCSTGLQLELGARVQHVGRGYGTVCLVDYDQDKCYHVQYDDGEVHRYNPIQAGFKFRLVEGTFSAVRLTISATSLTSMDLLGGADPYAVIRRDSDGAVIKKTETV